MTISDLEYIIAKVRIDGKYVDYMQMNSLLLKELIKNYTYITKLSNGRDYVLLGIPVIINNKIETYELHINGDI